MQETDESPSRQRDIASSKIKLNKFEIDTTRSIADFDHLYAEAFETTSLETGLTDHVAVVLKGRLPARQDVINVSMSSDFGNMVSLRHVGTADWNDGTQRFVLIYRRPGGNAIIPKHLQRREPLSEDIVRHGVIRPVFQALNELASKGLFHGNIRPDNIFMATSENAEAVLGECASSIPGINQPVMYETIERGMADPQGRGVGTTLDDIYAFGATVAVLLRGSNPMEGKPPNTVLEEKIIRSSFSVLTDGLRLSPGLSEFLRATLNDDPKQRWTIDQVNAWVDGTRTTPKQSSMGTKAQRALDFNGKKYMRTRMLAKDLHENVTEAVSLIESGNLVKWLERAMSDQPTADAINAAISRAGIAGRTAGYDDRLLSFVSMVLDPYAPIRFKEVRVFPAGIGFALAHAVATQSKTAQVYGEIIRDRYPWVYLSSKEHATPDGKSELLHSFDHASKIIIRRGIDFGIERCIYELCKSAPCLSPVFENHYVINCNVLINAIEDISQGKKPDRPMDRHIASFISVHDSRDNSGLLLLLEGSNAMKKSLALITLYHGLQKRNDNPKLPGLCEWLMKDAEIVAQRFHNLTLKQDVLRQIPKEIKSGNLSRLMALIDNPLQVKRDEHDFVQAGRYYNALNVEKEVIRKHLNSDQSFGQGQGRHIAMVMSVIITGIMIAMILFMNFMGGEI